MKKFKFSLEKVLQHRKTLERLAQSELFSAQADLRREESQLESLVRLKRDAFVERHREQQKAGPNLSLLMQMEEFILGQDLRIQQQKAKVGEFAKLVEDKREILSKAAQEVKIIERLKERKIEHFRHEFNLENQAELDENTVLRFRSEEEDLG